MFNNLHTRGLMGGQVFSADTADFISRLKNRENEDGPGCPGKSRGFPEAIISHSLIVLF